MTNEQMFEIFARIIGISFLVCLAIPIIGILCSIGGFLSHLLPERRLSDAEIDRIFGNNFSSKYEEEPVPARKKVRKNDLNTNSPVREYRLPDGSMVAFDTGKVEVSEKLVIE
jgi:hypothetical protein